MTQLLSKSRQMHHNHTSRQSVQSPPLELLYDTYYQCVNLYGMQELLAMVSQPVLAVLMLFPVTDASEKAKAEEDTRLRVSPRLLLYATMAQKYLEIQMLKC